MYYIGIQDLAQCHLQDIKSRAYEDSIAFYNLLILILPYLVLSQDINTFNTSLACLSNPVTPIFAGDHLEQRDD